MKQIRKLSFYEVNPRYFKDYSGNGVGDLAGLANKFDYFKFLGVDAIILQDVLASDESAKEGSYTNVAEAIGTNNDIVKLVSLAKKHQKGLLLEINVGSIKENHTWFKRAEEQDVEEFKEVVEFTSKKELDTLEYSYSQESKKYYQIDSKTQEVPLNWKSEQVLEHFVKVVRYWKEQGINGFVFKNFEYLADAEKKTPMSEASLKELRKFYRAIKEMDDNLIIVGKTDFLPVATASNYTQGATKVFDYFMTTEISRLGTDEKFGIDRIGKFSSKELAYVLKTFGGSNANVVSFGSKHVGRIISRWGNDGQYSQESAKALGMLLLLNKASSSIYFGDEIGTPNIGLTHLDNFQDKELSERKRVAYAAKIDEREFMDAQVLQNPINARALMAWDDTKNGGFSFAEKTVTPASTTYAEINVKNQFSDESSVLLFFKELNRIITQSTYAKIIEQGSYKVSSLIPGVIKITAKLENKEVKIFVNITEKVKPILFAPKSGKVVLTTYHNKPYAELPKKLEAFEGIIISKHTDEYLKETQQMKLAEEKAILKAEKEARKAEEQKRLEEEIALQEAAKEAARKEKEKLEAKEAAAKAKELAKREALEAAQREAAEEEKAKLLAEKEAEKEARALEKQKTQELKLAEKARTQELKLAEKAKTQELKLAEKAKTQELKVRKTQEVKLPEVEELKSNEKTRLTKLKEAARAEREVARNIDKTQLKEEELAKTTLIDDSIDLDELFADEHKKRRGK